MGTKNKIIWSDGLFIKPQHFQQQQRHIDYLLNGNIATTNCYFYGLTALTINHDLLKLGKIGITAATGIMPDGTFFEIPYQDLIPQPLEVKISSEITSKDIYLALPINNDVISEVDSAHESTTEITRYKNNVASVRDLHTKNGGSTLLNLAQLAPKLMQGSEDLSAYTALPICRIKEVHNDGSIILDEHFIPCITAIQVSTFLQKFLEEVSGLIAERAKQLASRIGSPSQQGIADVAEFLMLQLLNRYKANFTHLNKHKRLHPEPLYHQLVQICSELMTFTDDTRLGPIHVPYDHDNLTVSFQNLIIMTRQSLSIVLTPKAVSIPLSEEAIGLYIAVINDQKLLESAQFVLAVKSAMPEERLRKLFAQQTKITSPDKIRDLVTVQIAGVPITPLAAAPRQLPFHAGYTYFSLDIKASEWKSVLKAQSIAFHISGVFPELDMQLWAVRG